MMGDDDASKMLDDLERKAAARVAGETAKRAAEGATRKLEQLGHSLLDDLEDFLLGHEGAAEEILEREKQQGKPLDRIREEYGLDSDEAVEEAEQATRAPVESPVDRAARERQERRERALAELEALKARRSRTPDPNDPPPPAEKKVRRTL